MTSKEETGVQETTKPATDWRGKVEEQYRRVREDAETHPYVWASYILVYGGFAVWTTYRWRKLRKTEDRIRILQERLQKLVKEEESSTSASSIDKTQK